MRHFPTRLAPIPAVVLAVTPLPAVASESLLTMQPPAIGYVQDRQPAAAPSTAAPAPAPESAMNPNATFLLSRDYAHGDPQILWPGFLSGLRGFEHFYGPVSDPIYFETPFNTSELRLLYLWHRFPRGSQIGGGDLSVFAAQIRVAITERLGFIAVKDGYSGLNAGILPHADGWNNAAVGLKYALWVDRENDWVLTPGVRWEWENGDQDVLQGGTQEISPFISFAKGFDKLHFLGNVGARIPTDSDRGNSILTWDVHADYEAFPELLPGFAPLIEITGLHYLSNGDHLPLSIGGLDYTNLGSSDVAGDAVISGGLGFRWKLSPHVSFGSSYQFPFTPKNDDIMGERVTADLTVSW